MKSPKIISALEKQGFFRMPTFREMERRFHTGMIIGIILTINSLFFDGVFASGIMAFGAGIMTTAFLGNYHYAKIKRQIRLAAEENIDDVDTPPSETIKNNLSTQPEHASRPVQEKFKTPVPRIAGFKRRENAAKKHTPEQASRSWNPISKLADALWPNKPITVIKPAENSDPIQEASVNDNFSPSKKEKKPRVRHSKNRADFENKRGQKPAPVEPVITTGKPLTPVKNDNTASLLPPVAETISTHLNSSNENVMTEPASSTLGMLQSLAPTPSNSDDNKGSSLAATANAKNKNTAVETDILAPLRAELALEKEKRSLEEKKVLLENEKYDFERKKRTIAENELAELKQERDKLKQERDKFANKVKKITEIAEQTKAKPDSYTAHDLILHACNGIPFKRSNTNEHTSTPLTKQSLRH